MTSTSGSWLVTVWVAVAVAVTVETTVIIGSMPVATNVKVDVAAKVAVVVVDWIKEEQKEIASATPAGTTGSPGARQWSCTLHAYPAALDDQMIGKESRRPGIV